MLPEKRGGKIESEEVRDRKSFQSRKLTSNPPLALVPEAPSHTGDPLHQPAETAEVNRFQRFRSLDLLLRAELVGVTALLLAAVDCARRQTSVAHAADHLLAVVLARKHLQGRLNHATTQTEHQVQRRLLLDVVVGQGPTILQLLTCFPPYVEIIRSIQKMNAKVLIPFTPHESTIQPCAKKNTVPAKIRRC